MENGGKVWWHHQQALGTIAAKICPIYVTDTDLAAFEGLSDGEVSCGNVRWG